APAPGSSCSRCSGSCWWSCWCGPPATATAAGAGTAATARGTAPARATAAPAGPLGTTTGRATGAPGPTAADPPGTRHPRRPPARRPRSAPVAHPTTGGARQRPALRRALRRAREDGEVARTVLVVDDEPKILEVVRDYLADAGYTVVTAADGPSALERARAAA